MNRLILFKGFYRFEINWTRSNTRTKIETGRRRWFPAHAHHADWLGRLPQGNEFEEHRLTTTTSRWICEPKTSDMQTKKKNNYCDNWWFFLKSILNSFKNMPNVGWLQVKIIRAEGLASMDINGKSVNTILIHHYWLHISIFCHR